MKTSFAKVFMDQSQGVDSSDLIFTERTSERSIKNESGNDLLQGQLFVIEPLNSSYKSNKLSTLLVNKELKEKYDQIHENISIKKDVLLKEIKPFTGLKDNIEEALSLAFTHSPKEFYKSLIRVKAEVLDNSEAEFGDILYKNIFSEKILSFLKTKDFNTKLADYISKYDELIDSSTYFKKGVFNHNNASVVAKNLKDNGFFKAKHSIYLKSDNEKVEITTQAELEKVITQEKDSILSNPELVKAFDALDTKLKANKELRDFRDYLLSNLKILPELKNIDEFRQKLWISYLKIATEAYAALETEYSAGKDEIEKIVEAAKKEETEWRNVIDIFNKRFSVPFRLSVENQEDVILKSEGPNIKFIFKDVSEEKPINETDLLKVLSNGEKRALYILNIIFEVEARKRANQETLFIIDDIADSFDYKNKYAIVEYLKDISLVEGFSQILLSHNFDFFRTICGRLDMDRKQKLHTVKSDEETKLVEEKYQGNPFNHWKTKLEENNAMLIASIPFVRNIVDYSGDQNNFIRLTSLLHIKPDTRTIKISDLEEIHKSVLKDKTNLSLPNRDKLVVDLIYEEAEKITNENVEVIDLEGKIVLAIAVRLKAEEFMVSEINDSEFVGAITKNQTFKLYEKYTSKFQGKQEQIKILGQVNLMTPENIHINSFMYEPILDMANIALVGLYGDVKSLVA